MATPDDIRKTVGYGALGFGVVAALTPRAFLGLYGIPDDPNVRLMTRVWGTRTTVVGALTLLLRDPEARRVLMTAAVANEAMDTVLVATSGAPMRARVLGAATTAAFAVATGYVASQ